MFVLLDAIQMRVLAKCHDAEDLLKFAWIEHHDLELAIIDITMAKSLSAFTESELSALYKNITKCEFPASKYDVLIQVVYLMLGTVGETPFDSAELSAQQSPISKTSTYKYYYARGANEPVTVEDLFGMVSAKTSRAENALFNSPIKKQQPRQIVKPATDVVDVSAKCEAPVVVATPSGKRKSEKVREINNTAASAVLKKLPKGLVKISTPPSIKKPKPSKK